MQQKIMVLLTIGILMALPFVQAQTITGQVSDRQQQPALAATVALIRVSDSSIVKTTLPDNNGRFTFEKIAPATYRIWITMIGYKKYNSDNFGFAATQSFTLPAVILEQQDAQLKTVSVVAQKPFIERKIDRTVVNVDALISNAGTTALEVLQKSPGVTVDENNGSISLKGKGGVVIFIDDKPTYLSGNDLASYLRSLPSSTIETIELMPNPPAKYDAAGAAGVINIRTKRSKSKGFNGSLNLGYQQGRYANSSNGLNFTYRNNKLSIFGNAGVNINNGYSDLDIDRRFHDASGKTLSYFMQHSFLSRHSQSYSGKLGVDYYISEKNTFGLVFTTAQNPNHATNDNLSRLLDAQQQPDSSIHALNDVRHRFVNFGANANYRHQFDKNGRELTVDADYVRYNTGSNEVYNNFSYLPDNTPYAQDALTGRVPAHIDIYAAKTDYTHPFKDGYKLAAGLKTSYTSTDNLAEYFNTVNGATTPDYDKSNHFLYRENINAAYLNLNKDFKKLSIQAGLRFENTVSKGHQLGNVMKSDSSFNRNYTGLFPTLYLSYKLDTASNNVLALNYGRRIDRPYYEDLNPFISPLDKFTYYVGNPYVKPAYTQRVELSHTFKGRITTSLVYTRTKDDMNETIEIVNGIYYSRPGNIGSHVTKEIDIDIQQDLGKRLSLHFYGEAGDISSKGTLYDGTLNSHGTYVFVMPTLTLKLPKDWTLQADGRYTSQLTSAQFVLGRRGAVNAGISKKLNSHATLKLTGMDLFKTMINTGVINNLVLTDAHWRNEGDSRRVGLSFTYRFGKTISDQRNHENNGADSEKNRVKQ